MSGEMTPSVAQRGASLDLLLQEPTLCSAFLTAAEAQPDRIALREFGSDRTVTLGEWASGATRVAGGLRALGVERGDRVALLLSTRVDFHIVDMGAVLAGAAPFSLYVTSPVEQLAPCIDNALPRVLITEASLAGNARALRGACPVIEHSSSSTSLRPVSSPSRRSPSCARRASMRAKQDSRPSPTTSAACCTRRAPPVRRRASATRTAR
jgi:acyl-CoA synthetase (AMP-forming)/AMP-acid ligase II